MSGWPNVNPAASSFVGVTRCPSRSISSPIWPKAALTAKPGSGKDVGRCKGPAERLDELDVRDRAGRRHVDGPVERLLEREQVGGHGVVERDPAPPLASAADSAAGSELERQEQALQRTALLREHDAVPQVHRPQAGGAGRLRCSFPGLDDVREEARSRARSSRPRSSSPRDAVEPDGGGAEEDGPSGQPGGGLGDQPRCPRRGSRARAA